MTKQEIDEKLENLIIKLNKALKELSEQGDGFIDSKYFKKIQDISNSFQTLINMKNQLK